MPNQRRRPSATWIGPLLGLVVSGTALLIPGVALAQGLTGALIGTVSDQQGAAIAGALVRITSPALIGGSLATTTNERGQLRFPSLPPGAYVLEIELQGFGAYREADIRLGGGATIERSPILTPAGVAETIVVDGAGSRIDARAPGFATRFGAQDLDAIPSRRFSSYDLVKTAPGISPTSPAGSNVLVSALGSGVDQNQFLIDGTNVTATGNGVARADPGIDFIQELQIQSVGASVEYGNVQGAVVNVITKSGGDRFLSDTSYYSQISALTSQPVRRPYKDPRPATSATKYRDFSSTFGGPVVRDRLWFFSGYQHQRDYRQSAGHRSEPSEAIRTGQGLREAHHAPGDGLAVGPERSRRVLVEPRDAVGDQAARCDPAARRVGASLESRSSDAHRLVQHGVGCARGTVQLHAGHVADVGRSDDPESASISPKTCGAAAPS